MMAAGAMAGLVIAPTAVAEFGMVHEDVGRDIGPTPDGL